MSILDLVGRFQAGFRERALRSGAKDIEDFLEGMRNSGDRNVAALLAVATVVRVNMETHAVLPEGVFWNPPRDSERLGLMQMRINALVRQFLKQGNGVDATACRLWSLSLRCLNVPEYLPIGRAIWGEMGRGHAHVEEVLRTAEKANGKPLEDRVWTEWRRCPAGLEPEADEPA